MKRILREQYPKPSTSRLSRQSCLSTIAGKFEERHECMDKYRRKP